MGKPGIKTTEFWLTGVGMAIAGYASYYSYVHGKDATLAIIMTTVAGAIYTIARTFAKLPPK